MNVLSISSQLMKEKLNHYILWENRLPVLYKYIRSGDIYQVKRLLQTDPTLLRVTDTIENSKPLYMAVLSGSTELLNYFLKKTNVVDITTNSGMLFKYFVYASIPN